MKKTINLEQILVRLLDNQLSSDEFEYITEYYWQSGIFVQTCPDLQWIQLIKERVQLASEINYQVIGSAARFNSHRLFGSNGQPTAIHIAAPSELIANDLIQDRNRPPHWHDSGRISIITENNCLLYIHRKIKGKDCVINVELKPGHIVFWPAKIMHTFNAGKEGFSLLSAMAKGVAPDTEEFAKPASLTFDTLPKRTYSEYLQSINVSDAGESMQVFIPV